MRKFLHVCLVTLLGCISASAQNANPLIYISTSPPVVPIGTNTNLVVQAGNGGNDLIVRNSVELTIQVGINAEILGIAAGTDSRWTVFSQVPGAGGSIKIRNNSPFSFAPFDIGLINLTVKGVVEGGPLLITGNIAYIIGPNPFLGGAQSATQGNATPLDDNSATSLTVGSTNCIMQTLYHDNDGDGYGTGPSVFTCPELGLVTQTGDCDDTKINVHPNAPEFCDGLDNNCDGLVDNNCQTSSGNANPFITMSTAPNSVTIGNNSNLVVQAGNGGNDNIVANSLEITITAGTNTEILGIGAGSDIRWTQMSLSTGAGNTIRLRNTGGGFSPFDLGLANIIIKGVIVSSAQSITGNISYLIGPNPLLGGAQNATQGNSNTADDNAVTSLAVTPPCTPQYLFPDNDGDGYGTGPSVQTCPGPGFVSQSGDCDDTKASVHPYAPEICDGIDNNCDGRIDFNYEGNADPEVHMYTSPSPAIISVGDIRTISITAGNGFASIVPNSMELTISVGSNAEILRLNSGSDLRWTQYALVPGPGGSIKLRNTGNSLYTPVNSANLSITIKGLSIGGPEVITANISYIVGPNPLLCGAQNSIQGNTNTGNDNSYIPLTVIAACTHQVILAQEEIEMHRNEVIGNLGIWQAGKIVRVKEYSNVWGFITSPQVEVDASSTVYSITYSQATPPTAESFIYNRMPDPAIDITIPDNYQGVYELHGDRFRKITVGKNATARFFYSGNIYIKELITKDADINYTTTLTFPGSANLVIRKKLDLGKRAVLNQVGIKTGSIFVEQEDVHIGASSRVIASIDVRFKILVAEDATVSNHTVMNGLFIARKVDSKKWIDWYSSCAGAPPQFAPKKSNDESIVDVANTEIDVKLMPNPSNSQFTFIVSGSSESRFSINIFDITGKLVEQRTNNNINQKIVAGSALQPGTYFAEVKQGQARKIIKLIKL